jgi:hypothetical protein
VAFATAFGGCTGFAGSAAIAEADLAGAGFAVDFAAVFLGGFAGAFDMAAI